MFPVDDKHFQVLECINDVSATSNISDLSPFELGDNLRTNYFHEEMYAEYSKNIGDPLQIPFLTVKSAHSWKLKKPLIGGQKKSGFKKGL